MGLDKGKDRGMMWLSFREEGFGSWLKEELQKGVTGVWEGVGRLMGEEPRWSWGWRQIHSVSTTSRILNRAKTKIQLFVV